jgi:glycosyltransferase involved in cell wall biosynthesis
LLKSVVRALKKRTCAITYINSLAQRTTTVQTAALIYAAAQLTEWAALQNVAHVHGHSCAYSAHVLALSRLLGGPNYSLTLHGDLDVYGDDHAAKMTGASFVSAVGTHLIDQIVARVGLPREKLFTTFMGIDAGALAATADQRTYDEVNMRILTVARLERNKGHEYALAALRRARDEGMNIHYTIVGGGQFRNEIVAMVDKLGLRNDVELLGSLAEEGVFDSLRTSDVFLLPSVGKGEAWPVAVMEAMGAGMPVVATDIGATSEMIANGRDGFLVRQREPNDIVEVLRSLYQSSELRRSIGRQARATAVARFAVERSAESLLAQVERSLRTAGG